MASTGLTFPGSGTNSNPGSGLVWTNPGNILATDASYATCSPGFLFESQTLWASQFGFSIPTGAVITGFEVSIVRKSSISSAINNYEVYMTKQAGLGFTTPGSNLAYSGSNPTWTTSDATETFGGASNLWGTTWTVAEVNTFGFGVILRIAGSGGAEIASVNSVQMAVHYSTFTPSPMMHMMQAAGGLI